MENTLRDWIGIGRDLCEASGLMHDIGKASRHFDAKLRGRLVVAGDDVRHEWLSMKLLQAMRGNGRDWSAAWSHLRAGLSSVTLGNRRIGSHSSLGVTDALEAIDWLIVSHHGLFHAQQNSSAANGNPMCPSAAPRHVRREPCDDQVSPVGEISPQIWDDYFRLQQALESDASHQNGNGRFWYALALIARVALVAADHRVSRKVLATSDAAEGVFANTCEMNGKRVLNQPLDWHLREVGLAAALDFSEIARWIEAGSVSGTLRGLQNATVERATQSAGSTSRFAWQDCAAEALRLARATHAETPSLVLNMAGTGSGKTRMNLRAACVLSRDVQPRVSIALNLRNLTLQSGEALRKAILPLKSEMAVVIGDQVSLQLFQASRKDSEAVDVDENPTELAVEFAGGCEELPVWLQNCVATESERRLLATPLLVSTVDFLVAAGEPGQQGRFVKAWLRTASTDLILDEVDSYEPEALVAVLRVVQMAALAGRQVVCSSATLSKATAYAVMEAFRTGVRLRAALLGSQKADWLCALIDDQLSAEWQCLDAHDEVDQSWFDARVDRLMSALRSAPPYRLAQLLPVADVSEAGWTSAVVQGCQTLHAWHAWPCGEHKVSFGLVRVANIATAVDTARSLADAMPDARVACYHSGDFRMARFLKEQRLDKLLSRAAGDEHIAVDAEIRALLDEAKSRSVAFIVVATPVEEIGRDHDFDWAVVDVSSAQSLVQASGRVNRHRLVHTEGFANVLVPQFNWRHCARNQGDSERAAFCYPGYELTRPAKRRRANAYGDHDLAKLLPWASDGYMAITAGIRFDPNCGMAKADDEAIQRRVQPYFGRGGVWVGDAPHSWLMTQGPGSPYQQTPLRGEVGHSERWEIGGDALSVTFHRTVALSRGGKLVEERLPDVISEVPSVANAWLGVNVDAMRAACRRWSIAERDGLSAELSRYDPQEMFVYDAAFGVKRVARN